MTNYERCKKDIDKLALAVTQWGVVDGEVKRCGSISCEKCAFNAGRRSCESIRLEWIDQECKESEVDWSKVPVDAKVLVSDDEKTWYRGHFSRYDKESGYYLIWRMGFTSFTARERWEETWKYAKLAEEK